jgi:hypothetical protein
VSLSPHALRSAPTLDVTPRPAASVRTVPRGCYRWSRSVACVPTAAKERAPHLGGELRCSGSMCRRLGVSHEDLSARYRSARRLPRPARSSGGGQRRPPTTPLSSAPHTQGGAVRTARRKQTFGKCRRSSRSFRGFFRTSPVRVTSDRAERRKVAAPPARSPWVGLRFHNRSCPQLFHSEVGDE